MLEACSYDGSWELDASIPESETAASA